MKQLIAHITLLVNNYDEAIQYYTQMLEFELLKDTSLSESKRWVLVSTKVGKTSLLLAKASTPEQKKHVGNQACGRVFLFLHTDDF